ncbi:MAG TPA: ATP-binding protein [Actinophytocola sp.]|nr:ATP-binding protein [Actinophytocola sp.]HET9143917.1 ATP-binding protein [Actinophytocola sp.]
MDEHDPDGIELRLAARLEHLPIIRSVAANLAIRADFDLDSIADLKLAVDEACSTLITRATKGATLSCRFFLRPNEIRFAATVHSKSDHEPSRDSFGWRVLTTLTDRAETWVEVNGSTPDGRGPLVHIELTKRKTLGG